MEYEINLDIEEILFDADQADEEVNMMIEDVVEDEVFELDF